MVFLIKKPKKNEPKKPPTLSRTVDIPPTPPPPYTPSPPPTGLCRTIDIPAATRSPPSEDQQ